MMARTAKGQDHRRRPFLASFFTPSKSSPASRLRGFGTRSLPGRRARVQRQAAIAGAGSFLGELAGSRAGGTDALRAERRQRRKLVRGQYLKEVRRLKEARARAERELAEHLSKRERVIAHQRGLYQFDPSDSGQVRTKEFADARFSRVERQQREHHKKQWDEAKRELERSRDEQYRLISKELKTERRESFGLPPALRTVSLGGLVRGRAASDGQDVASGGRVSFPSFNRDGARGRDWRVGEVAPDNSSGDSAEDKPSV